MTGCKPDEIVVDAGVDSAGNTGAFAGIFNGDVLVTGAISAGNQGFQD